MACDAPCDLGCVIFPEYLFIPALVAIFRAALPSQLNSNSRRTVP
jgi:hypothetical protein